MYKIILILVIVGVPIILATIGSFSAKDITPDAITMATTHNTWTGDVASLTDGRTPDIDPDAPAFVWDWIGLLAVSWPDTVRLQTIRVYLGEMYQYRVFGYLGGGFTEEGFRVGGLTSLYGHEAVVPAGVTGWYDIPGSPEFAIDNISFQVVGGAVIYEIQFLSSDGAAIRLVGDFDGDNEVGLSDFVLFLDVFGTTSSSTNWDSTFDLDNDEEVGLSDFVLFLDNFGKTG